MKPWHWLLPLLAMTTMALAFEKRETDALASELAIVHAAGHAPADPRGPGAAPSGNPSQARTATSASMRDHYQLAFERESREGTWADSAERLAEDRLKALLPPTSAVRAVECRASMCRLETSHADRPTYQAFLHAAFLGPSPGIWNAAQFSTRLDPQADGGPLRVVSYLAREGRSLPSVD
ncbi:MAG TPA: hypothetical protein VGI39_26740 [Polyangiaceae bacterium]|jgi:hypothetical protein